MTKTGWLAIKAIALFIGLCLASPAQAQAIGQCNTPVGPYLFFPDGRFVQANNPNNQGFVARDASGQTFLRLSSPTPQWAFFIAWTGQLLRADAGGVWIIGQCSFRQDYIPANPWAQIYMPPPIQPNYGFTMPNGQLMQVPQAFANPATPYGQPLFVTEAEAMRCANSTEPGARVTDQPAFESCMMRAMLGDRELAALECARQERSNAGRAFCMVGVLGGENERAIAGRLKQCYDQHGTRWQLYSLCLASDQLSNDQARLLNCVAQQYQQSGSVNVFATAICYGADRIPMNTETQIIVSCAVSTGGEPEAFAACAGGQLSAMELEKCFTNGVGGSGGCFGPNNSIVRAMGATGDMLAQLLGANHEVVRLWRATVEDVTSGRATSRVASQVLRTTMNEGRRAADNVVRAASQAGGGVLQRAQQGARGVRREAERIVRCVFGC